MMEQKEVVQEHQDAVVSVAVSDEEKERIEKETTRKQQVYNATVYFVLGLFLIFAPVYIQTEISWIVNVSLISCLACWGASFHYITEAYPRLFNNMKVIIILCLFGAIDTYALSEMSGKLISDPNFKVELRIGSFICLLGIVALLLEQYSEIAAFFKRHKGKMRAFFTTKHTIAIILGILSVGTALFQFIQVVLQIFHI